MPRFPWIAPLLLVLPFASACAAGASPAASSPDAAASPPLAEASSGAKLCGKAEPVEFKLRKDGGFYFDVDAREHASHHRQRATMTPGLAPSGLVAWGLEAASGAISQHPPSFPAAAALWRGA